ncbi:hypothetical protein [Streptomyces adelaidensis]|uniref:hypothetical protein n=1 Tax=Streptomyces adelaidensis TaxID=2796465 RepID=UPI0019079064|nr:hypothetical protein [Streptomyces adelaidensis]
MDEPSYNYDLDSNRGRGALEMDIRTGKVEMKSAADILKGHPCENEFVDMFPCLAHGIQEPPDDSTSPTT